MQRTIAPGDLFLGKYRAERVLGQGGMGVVLAVRHVELGQLFALKVLHAHALSQEAAIQRFLREARATARLRSEHTVRVADAGRMESGLPYMVMEYLDGSDLAAVLRRRSPLLEDAVECILQACEALSEAHATGIVHRDLKPANLFLTRRPSGGLLVKVLDFGIAKQRDAEDLVLTRQGEILGSQYYMSPEQLRGDVEIDGRSDIWSMGVLLYRLVTGELPFRGKSMCQFITNLVHTEPPPPCALRPGLPPALDTVLALALAKDPALRFQGIDDLASALRSAIRRAPPSWRASLPSLAPVSLPVTPRSGGAEAEEPSTADVGRRLRKRTGAAGIKALLLAASVGAAATAALSGEPTPSTRPEARPLSAVSSAGVRVPCRVTAQLAAGDIDELWTRALRPAQVAEKEPSLADEPPGSRTTPPASSHPAARTGQAAGPPGRGVPDHASKTDSVATQGSRPVVSARAPVPTVIAQQSPAPRHAPTEAQDDPAAAGTAGILNANSSPPEQGDVQGVAAGLAPAAPATGEPDAPRE